MDTAASSRDVAILAWVRALFRCATATKLATMASAVSVASTATAPRASRIARRCCRRCSPMIVSFGTPRMGAATAAIRSVGI
jgi:hypothetical protein